MLARLMANRDAALVGWRPCSPLSQTMSKVVLDFQTFTASLTRGSILLLRNNPALGLCNHLYYG